MAVTTASTLPHLIFRVLRGIYMRFTLGTYFTFKSGGSTDFGAFRGVLFLGTLFIYSPLSGSLHGLSTYICHCIMSIVHFTHIT